MSRRHVSRREFVVGTAAVAASVAVPAFAKKRELVVISNRSNPQQRVALERIAARFGQAASAKVSVNNMDHEAHKTAIRNYLVASPPDICFWFSGERMRGFVERGLFADISDLVAAQGWSKVVPAMGAVSVQGRQYGLPTAGVLWGLFYRQDTFAKFGLKPPASLDELVSMSDKAQAAGLTPISMGTKNAWPAAGWFDHMNLRMNGLDFHKQLMAGKVAYTDARVLKVMRQWAELCRAGLFTKNASSYAWEQAAAALVQQRAAMMDLGSFIKQAFPVGERDQVRFQLFPTIEAGIGRYEDFSVDSVHIPARAPNPELAREFLAYFYAPENLKEYIEPDGNPPARTDVDLTSDPLIAMATNALKTVDGTSQYFDRDANPDVAQAGLKGFQEFMAHPERVDQVLSRIEHARKRAYRRK